MEDEIEEYLNEKYRLKLEVTTKEFRYYLVRIKFDEKTAEITFAYDNKYTFTSNMNSLSHYIDKCILEYYRKEEK